MPIKATIKVKVANEVRLIERRLCKTHFFIKLSTE
jgi:hypothetical protein